MHGSEVEQPRLPRTGVYPKKAPLFHVLTKLRCKVL